MNKLLKYLHKTIFIQTEEIRQKIGNKKFIFQFLLVWLISEVIISIIFGGLYFPYREIITKPFDIAILLALMNNWHRITLERRASNGRTRGAGMFKEK